MFFAASSTLMFAALAAFSRSSIVIRFGLLCLSSGIPHPQLTHIHITNLELPDTLIKDIETFSCLVHDMHFQAAALAHHVDERAVPLALELELGISVTHDERTDADLMQPWGKLGLDQR